MYLSLVFTTFLVGVLAQYDIKTAAKGGFEVINEEIVVLDTEDYYYQASLRIIMDYLKSEALRMPGYKVIIRLTRIQATKQYVVEYQRYQYSFTFQVDVIYECVHFPCGFEPTPVPPKYCTVVTYVGPYGSLEIIGGALNCYFIDAPPLPVPIPVPDPQYDIPIPVKI